MLNFKNFKDMSVLGHDRMCFYFTWEKIDSYDLEGDIRLYNNLSIPDF